MERKETAGNAQKNPPEGHAKKKKEKPAGAIDDKLSIDDNCEQTDSLATNEQNVNKKAKLSKGKHKSGHCPDLCPPIDELPTIAVKPSKKKKPEPKSPIEFTDESPLTEAERYEVQQRLLDEKKEKTAERRRESMRKAQAARAEQRRKVKEDATAARKERELLDKKVKQGKIGKDGLPAIKPLAWLKEFRSEYEVSAEDLRRMCMAFIFGHSIDELKLMTAPENSHKIPVLVYYFAKQFIADTENGDSEAMEKLLDRIYGKAIVKEMKVNVDVPLKENLDADQRRLELERLEAEVRMLTADDVEITLDVK